MGALLTVINHGDELIQGNLDTTLGWQVGLTFLVPFVVATISGAAAIRWSGPSPLDTHTSLSRDYQGRNS